MTALAKLCLLFVGGITVGLVVPWGFGPNKPAPRPEETGRASERFVTVRCIVEYHHGAPPRKSPLKRLLPGPEELQPEERAAPPVEIVVQPGAQRVPAGDADDVILIFRFKPNTSASRTGAAPPERPMPGAM